jgi:hypothetical protein
MPARKPSGRPTGNPKVEIDWDKVDQLLLGGCLGTEIAPHFGICDDTLYIRCEKEKGVTWSAYMRQKRSKGDSNLRMKQYQVAMSGDRSLLIWLGKQRLGQRENEQNVEFTPEQLIQFKAVMEFLDKSQSSALNKAESNKSSEEKS